MKLLTLAPRTPARSVEDQQIQARVDEQIAVMTRWRGLDWKGGYREGWHNGFRIGFAVASALGALGLFLVGVLR